MYRGRRGVSRRWVATMTATGSSRKPRPTFRQRKRRDSVCQLREREPRMHQPRHLRSTHCEGASTLRENGPFGSRNERQDRGGSASRLRSALSTEVPGPNVIVCRLTYFRRARPRSDLRASLDTGRQTFLRAPFPELRSDALRSLAGKVVNPILSADERERRLAGRTSFAVQQWPLQ